MELINVCLPFSIQRTSFYKTQVDFTDHFCLEAQVSQDRTRGGGGAGGASAPPPPHFFLEILKSYWEKGVFRPPLWVFSQPPPSPPPPPPTFKVAPWALQDTFSWRHWLPVASRISFKMAFLLYKALKGCSPSYITELLYVKPPGRDQHLLLVPRTKCKFCLLRSVAKSKSGETPLTQNDAWPWCGTVCH